MKRLICLCLVLALAGSAGAATAIWNGPIGSSGDWETGTNWGGSGLPTSSNDTYLIRGSSSAQSIITVTTTGAAALRFFVGQSSSTLPTGVTGTSSNILLTINSGAALRTGRDFQQFSYKTGSVSVVDVYGTINACVAPSSGLNMLVSSGAASVSNDTVNVYSGGVVNVGTTGTGTQSGTLSIAASGSGTGTVNIYSGGVVNARTGYTIGANGKLNLENTGKIWIYGNVTGTVAADILAGKIAGITIPGAAGVTYGYDSTHAIGNVTGATWILGVPEPATCALLGLGSLMLIRKRR